MILTGISDEAGNTLDTQIAALQELGWKHVEMRGVEVPGYAKGNFHEIPQAAFDLAIEKFSTAGIEVYCFGSTIMNWAKKVNDPPFQVTLDEVSVSPSTAHKCVRCWRHPGDVKAAGQICGRCQEAIA